LDIVNQYINAQLNIMSAKKVSKIAVLTSGGDSLA